MVFSPGITNAYNGDIRPLDPTAALPAPALGDLSGALTLGLNHYGPPVMQLQQMLNLVGAMIAATGYFGAGTEEAVRKFQRKEGLHETGRVDGRTLSAMRRVGAARDSAAPPRPGPGRAQTRRVVGDDPRRRYDAPSGPTVPAHRFIDAGRPASPKNTGPAKPAELAADKQYRRSLLTNYSALKYNGRDWTGHCNAFAQRMMWNAGPGVKANAEGKRLTARKAALAKARASALAGAPRKPLSRNQRADLLTRVKAMNPRASKPELRQLYDRALSDAKNEQPKRLTGRQRQRLAKTQRGIKRRYAAKNMHNYLPPLTKPGTKGEPKAYRGDTMRGLAAKIESGESPRLRPGMTIHVKAFPNEKAPYGKRGDPNNPKDQNHHWFTYVGKNDKGQPMFADSRGKQRTAADCDRWLTGWMRSTLRKGQTRLGDYRPMRARLAAEGKYKRGRLAPGVQPRIEGIYNPHD